MYQPVSARISPYHTVLQAAAQGRALLTKARREVARVEDGLDPGRARLAEVVLWRVAGQTGVHAHFVNGEQTECAGA